MQFKEEWLELMRNLDVPAQEKLIELLSSKLSDTGNRMINPTNSNNKTVRNVRNYRMKVVQDLEHLLNQARSDPANIGNELRKLANELMAQQKIRTAHEQTIADQKKLIEELRALKNKNPVMERVRQESPLPPINKNRPNTGRSLRSQFSSASRSPSGTNTSMFELQLDEPAKLPPTRGNGRRGAPTQQRGGPGLGQGGPVFGGGKNDRGRGVRGARGARRGYGRY